MCGRTVCVYTNLCVFAPLLCKGRHAEAQTSMHSGLLNVCVYVRVFVCVCVSTSHHHRYSVHQVLMTDDYCAYVHVPILYIIDAL